MTQPRRDGQMETCFEDGLMGGWGRGPSLPASPAACHPALPGLLLLRWQLTPHGRRLAGHRPPNPSPMCHPGVPKAINHHGAARAHGPRSGLGVRRGTAGGANPSCQHIPGLWLAVPKRGDSVPKRGGSVPKPHGGFYLRVCSGWQPGRGLQVSLGPHAPRRGQGSPGHWEGAARQVGACRRQRGPAGTGCC